MNKKEIKMLERILINQRTILRNLAFGFTTLKKDELLNESLLVAVEKTTKLLNGYEE